MTCFFGHKWGKWEQYLVQMKYYPPGQEQNPPLKYEDKWQKRTCEKCGFMQELKVKEGIN